MKEERRSFVDTHSTDTKTFGTPFLEYIVRVISDISVDAQ